MSSGWWGRLYMGPDVIKDRKGEAGQAWASAGTHPRNSKCWKGVICWSAECSIMHGLPGWLSGKNLPTQSGEVRGARRAIVHGVTKSPTQLSNWAQLSAVSCINKEAFCWNRIEIPEKAQIYMKSCHWLKIAYQIGKEWTFKISVIQTTGHP